MVGLASPLAVVLLKAQWMEEILWVKNKWAVLGVDKMAMPVVVVLPEALLMDAHSSLLQRLSIFKDLAQLSIFWLFNKRRKYTVERARSSFKLINRNFAWTEHRSLCSALVLTFDLGFLFDDSHRNTVTIPTKMSIHSGTTRPAFCALGLLFWAHFKIFLALVGNLIQIYCSWHR